MLWRLLLVSLPVTSFPWLLSIVGGSVVGPLSAIPLMPLLLLRVAPDFARGHLRGNAAGLFLAFCSIAVMASALSPFWGLQSFMGEVPSDRTVRAVVTLGVGAGYYLVATRMFHSMRQVQSSLRWIYLGCLLTLAWSSVQIGLILAGFDEIPFRLRDFHRLFSIRDMHLARATGFAFEPSWLANQLVLLYLPLLFGSVLSRHSAFRKLRGWLTAELVLLLWTGVVLFFSLSRIGLLSLSAILGTALVLHIQNRRWVEARKKNADRSPASNSGDLRRGDLPRWATVSLAVMLIAGVMAGVLYGASLVDERVARLFRFDFRSLTSTQLDPAYYVASRLAFAERLSYWTSGLRVFLRFPILGVGLGNTGFLFSEVLPVYGYGLPEIVRIIMGTAAFPNPKNLWIRLLAETGIVGFGFFVAWLIASFNRARNLRAQADAQYAAIGTAGILALVAQVFEGFSLDTFALPYLWIIMGLVTGAPLQRSGGQDEQV